MQYLLYSLTIHVHFGVLLHIFLAQLVSRNIMFLHEHLTQSHKAFTYCFNVNLANAKIDSLQVNVTN